MVETEFKSFMSEFISPKVSSHVTIYTNAGILDDYKALLYKNALATKKGLIWSDENGYIKIAEKQFTKLEDNMHNLPILARSTKTGEEVAHDLISNIKECWSDNIALPMLTLGNMIMSIYYDKFINTFGSPTLILYGDTGKTTLATVGLAIFGLSKNAMTSGGVATAKSNEYFCSKYNCLNVCVDDVKAETLNSRNFIA